ncbi:MAG TPA: AcvB/VirJ family lysyl-phosphatidylglycerol hydrolase, partial [Bacteroidales bacterium]|nr:AcvB/VirJ family lysyl-phosphatidylglycerol hydrolase [Bacteroidales bacterium]
MKTRILLILFIVFSLSPEAFPGPDDSLKLRNLPIVIITTSIHNPEAPVALLITGDGGWYHFEQSIANSLAKRGIPTVGLDSRKYFWNRRTPGETATDVALALSYYAKEWHRNKFVLIGYSLGAEIVPFIFNRLPEEMKRKIQSTVLLSPDVTTDFEIHFSNMMGIGNKQNTYGTIEEIIKMQE